MLLAGAGALALILLLMPNLFKTRNKPVKHHAEWYLKHGKPLPQRLQTKSGKPLPRSVGTKKAGPGTSAKGYAAAGGGFIPLKYNKDGSVKKASQVAGTLAAKQKMAKLRKLR